MSRRTVISNVMALWWFSAIGSVSFAQVAPEAGSKVYEDWTQKLAPAPMPREKGAAPAPTPSSYVVPAFPAYMTSGAPYVPGGTTAGGAPDVGISGIYPHPAFPPPPPPRCAFDCQTYPVIPAIPGAGPAIPLTPNPYPVVQVQGLVGPGGEWVPNPGHPTVFEWQAPAGTPAILRGPGQNHIYAVVGPSTLRWDEAKGWWVETVRVPLPRPDFAPAIPYRPNSIETSTRTVGDGVPECCTQPPTTSAAVSALPPCCSMCPRTGKLTGTWVRELPGIVVAATAAGDELKIRFTQCLDEATATITLTADYTLTREGLLYGVVTGVDVEQKHEPGTEPLAEVVGMEAIGAQVLQKLVDCPFSCRTRPTSAGLMVSGLRFSTGTELKEMDFSLFPAILGGMYKPSKDGLIPVPKPVKSAPAPTTTKSAVQQSALEGGATGVDAGMTLPSPSYLQHYPQYYPPEPPRELAGHKDTATCPTMECPLPIQVTAPPMQVPVPPSGYVPPSPVPSYGHASPPRVPHVPSEAVPSSGYVPGTGYAPPMPPPSGYGPPMPPPQPVLTPPEYVPPMQPPIPPAMEEPTCPSSARDATPGVAIVNGVVNVPALGPVPLTFKFLFSEREVCASATGTAERRITLHECLAIALQHINSGAIRPTCCAMPADLPEASACGHESLQAEVRKNYLLANVEVAYWQLLAAHHQVVVLEQALQGIYLYTVRNRAMGDAAVCRNECCAQMERLHCTLLEARNVLQESERQLRVLLGLRCGDGMRLVPVEMPDFAHALPELPAAVAEALANRPELIHCRQELKVQHLNLMLQRNLARPDLRFVTPMSVQGQGIYQGSVEPGTCVSGVDASPMMRAMPNGPVMPWDRGAAVRAAELDLSRCHEQLRDTEAKVGGQVMEAYGTALQAHTVLESVRAERQALNAHASRLQALISTGNFPPEDFRKYALLQEQLTATMAAEVRARAQYLCTVAMLEFAKGTIQKYHHVAAGTGPQPMALPPVATCVPQATASPQQVVIKVREAQTGSFMVTGSVNSNQGLTGPMMIAPVLPVLPPPAPQQSWAPVPPPTAADPAVGMIASALGQMLAEREQPCLPTVTAPTPAAHPNCVTTCPLPASAVRPCCPPALVGPTPSCCTIPVPNVNAAGMCPPGTGPVTYTITIAGDRLTITMTPAGTMPGCEPQK